MAVRKRGDAESDFNKIGRDLDRAISWAGFSQVQAILVNHARNLSWSMSVVRKDAKAYGFRFNPTAISALGPSRQNVYRGIEALTRRRVFADLGDGLLKINKDYSEWLDALGKPLFTPAQLDLFTTSVRAYAKAGGTCYHPDDPATEIPLDPTPVFGALAHQSLSPAHQSLSPAHQSLSPAHQTHNRFARAERVLEEGIGEGLEECMNAGGPAAHISGGPAIRDPEDLRHVREAQAVLASDLRTDHLGLDLGRRHNTPELLTVPGWKFLRGARIQTGPTIGDNPRKSWPYYIKIVLNIGDDEQGKPLPWEASARPTAPNKAEVRRRELKEGFRRKQELERERGATDGPS